MYMQIFRAKGLPFTSGSIAMHTVRDCLSSERVHEEGSAEMT